MQEKRKNDEEVIEAPIQHKVPLARTHPEVLAKIEAQLEIKTVFGGTSRKGKRMANVLKVVMKPLKLTSHVTSKATTIPLSTPVAGSSTSELNVASSPKASLEGSVSKVC